MSGQILTADMEETRDRPVLAQTQRWSAGTTMPVVIMNRRAPGRPTADRLQASSMGARGDRWNDSSPPLRPQNTI